MFSEGCVVLYFTNEQYNLNLAARHFYLPNYNRQISSMTRGGSRIPRRRGRQPSGGAPTYDFAKFCEKLPEIEKILGRRGGRSPLNPPLMANRNLADFNQAKMAES